MNTNKIKITNSAPHSVTLFLEPWAEEFELTPGKTINFELETTEANNLQLEYVDKELAIYGDLNSKLTIYRHETAVWRSYNF
jgi:hypothetical protein